MIEYAELHAHSYFSLLDGASSPEELVERGAALGLTGLALTDHDSLAGAVRFWRAANAADLHPIIGGEITLADGHHLTLLAETQTGYANLCRIITAGRIKSLTAEGAEGSQRTQRTSKISAPSAVDALSWAGKVDPAVGWDTLADHSAGLIALTGCRRGPVAEPLLRGDEAGALAAAERLRAIFGPDCLFVEVQHHLRPDDDRLVRKLLALADQLELPAVATNNVHYVTPDAAPMRDVLVAIGHLCTVDDARRAGHLFPNRSYALASPAEMAHRFAERPDLLARTLAVAERCQVSLDFSGQRLPRFPTPDGQSEFDLLYQLCHDGLPARYSTLTPAILSQLAHELAVIQAAGLAGYFLIVWDIMRFARSQGIRCQGRGSAANSLVAYLLHITAVDPLAHDLLFERFLSPDKFTAPDIDLDFAADRREEVIQYVYRLYGSAHTGMVCNVVTFRERSARRDWERAMDNAQWTMHNGQEADHPVTLSPPFPGPQSLLGLPRHLSIHSGGMLVTGPPLTEVVPLEPATMPGRVVAQWDKHSVEDAGLIKIDLLGLRTLGMITEALAHIRETTGETPDLDALPLDDPALFAMLQRGDTVGAFQVESRAQQQMLPRLKPERFEDIVVEIAIVRPGPIQGGAVHPYLRRRAGLEPVTYAHPCLEPVLAETLGVLLFQEQALRVAVAAADFTPGEADLLRRALSRAKDEADLQPMRARFVRGALAKGMDEPDAHAVFDQLAGFAGYGFCKSHAAGFALIAYQTLWLKRYHHAAFTCALLNHQPMGFYSTEVLVGDAKRHGVDFLPVDVNRSDWNQRMERISPQRRGERKGEEIRENPSRSVPSVFYFEEWGIRMGLRAVKGVGEAAWERMAAARQLGPFRDLADFCRRTRLPQDVITALIRAGAMDAFGQRRQQLWQLGSLDYRPHSLDMAITEPPIDLPDLPDLTRTLWEYELTGLSVQGHLLGHYRDELRRAGIAATWEVKQAEAGQRMRVAGLAVVRQRPSTAKGMVFLSLEDESGLLDVVIRPDVHERVRDVLKQHPLILVSGLVQRNGRAVSLLAGWVRGLE